MDQNVDHKIKRLSEDLRDLSSNKIEYAKLSVVERLAVLGGRLSVVLVRAFLLMTSIMFALLGAGIALGYWVNNMALGFVIIALVLVLFIILFNLIASKSVRKIISDLIVSSLLGEVSHEE